MLSNFLLYVLPGFLAGALVAMWILARDARQQNLILLHLLEHGEDHGLGMIKAGCGKRGTIYACLNRMENRGLIQSWVEPLKRGEIGLPQRFYMITEAGRAALLVEKARFAGKERTCAALMVRAPCRPRNS